MRVIRTLGVTLVAMLGLVAAALGAAYILYPKERLVALAAAQVEAATGRALTIEGAVTPAFYPVLGLQVEDVALANAPWAEAPALIAADAASVGVRLAPLFSGRLEIEEIRLTAPTVSLEVNAQGEANWLLGGDGAGTQAQASIPDGAARGRDIEIGAVAVTIENGALIYADAVSNVRYVANAVNVSTTLEGLDAPARVEGDAAINDRPAALTLTLDSPQAALDGGAAQIDLALSLADAQLAYQGALTLEGLVLDGRLSLEAPDAPALAQVLGATAPDVVRRIAADAAVRFGPDRVLRLTDLEIRADANAAAGEVSIDISADRPAITARLRADTLDLRAIQASGGGTAAGGGAAGGGGGGAGWSSTPLDLSPLRAVDADIALQAGAITLEQATLTDVDLAADLSGGALDLRIGGLRVFGGTLSGTVTARDGATPAVSADLTLSGLQLQPTLIAAASVDQLTGTGAATVDVAAQGGSVDALMRSLGGTAMVRLTDGAVLGVNVAAMVRQALGQGGGGGPLRTDFAEISASFAIDGGVARNGDLTFLGPLLRATGAGTINLGAQSLDYRLTPRVVATLEGQGGAADQQGLSVPLIIRGPWAAPTIEPDLASVARELLNNPAAAADSLQALEQGAAAALGAQEGENVDDAVKRTLDAAKEDPAKAIQGILGGGGLRGLFSD